MISEADASIFNVHLMFLEDRNLIDKLSFYINKNMYSVEYAIVAAYHDFEKMFMNLEDATFRERVMDLKDVMLRLN